MGKSLFIAEKPSVAAQFAAALKEPMTRHDGYTESEHTVVTWCVGHLITLSYPDAYDEKYKRWSLDTLPFIPDHWRYEVIPATKKQFTIVSRLLNRKDVDTIYVCTDSGREGEYIYRLVAQEAGVTDKNTRRVWIDSQTEEEILRGIREAKDISAYDHLADAAYLRAREDYLMGINFSRVLTLRYGSSMSSFLGERHSVISVGRVMTCVLGMVVRREREIRNFVKTPYYRVLSSVDISGSPVEGEFRAAEGSAFFASPKLYRENGFKQRIDAQALIAGLTEGYPPPYADILQRYSQIAATDADAQTRQAAFDDTWRAEADAHPQLEAEVVSIDRKKEKKNPPLLYNLAELQNDCSRMFKISPDQTLNIAQELYEKKLVTYPRTDARVLSTAIAKEIHKNIQGLTRFEPSAPYAGAILEKGSYRGIEKTRYTNDSQITDHYALIPTGQGLNALRSLSRLSYGVYCAIVRRFLRIFYPPAEYLKISMVTRIGRESFFCSTRVLEKEGYLAVMKPEKKERGDSQAQEGGNSTESAAAQGQPSSEKDGETLAATPALLKALSSVRRGARLPVLSLSIKEGQTSPPKRYNSGSMILAMENAGSLIEDEDLRAQIKGSGIGTSATRAEILKKLVTNQYILQNKKTQVLSPTLRGEMIYEVCDHSIRALLSPELTASWERGLTYVTEGTLTSDEYMEKLRGFVVRRTNAVKNASNQAQMRTLYQKAAAYYKKTQYGQSRAHRG